jgi:hypothetical protein
LLKFRATPVLAGSMAFYAACEMQDAMQRPMRVVIAAGLAVALFLTLTLSAPRWLSIATSPNSATSVGMPGPTPDPHP